MDYFEPSRGRESRRLQQVLAGLVASGEVLRSRHGEYRLAAAADDGQPVLPAVPVVAVLVRSGRGWCADSVDPAFDGRIDLATPPGADAGAVVSVELTTVSARRAEGRVQAVIEAGNNEAARAAEALLAAHRVPRHWPFDSAKLGLPTAISAADRAGRRDLRELPLVTIDGADARDFDDAVYAAPVAGGGWRLVVAIADVSHYVLPDTALDAAARQRGNSLYLPDRVVPMLPEAISNHLCSLVPGEDRLSVACEMRISAKGRIGEVRFATAVIHSKARLTYAQVAAFLAGRPLPEGTASSAAVAASLTALHGVYRALQARREARGALDFDTRETRLTLRAGQPVGVAPVARTDAHRLIEEAMIAANVAAARHLERAAKVEQDPAPSPLYRIHESPGPAKLATLSLALALAGERLPAGRPTPAALAAAAARARAKSSWPGWIWDAAVLRSLEQARYAPLRRGHFGLALPTYLHFTSPIRRYADLVVHRAIKGSTMTADELDAVGTHVSMTERRAETVERGVDAWLKCALVSAHIGETREGTIAAVAAFGAFVELDGLFVQGLLHVSKLGRDYFHHVPAAMALVAERSGARFGVGDRVTVTLEDVAVAAGRIDLALAVGPARRRGRRQGPKP